MSDTIACARCSTPISADAAYMSAGGSVCAQCHGQEEINASLEKGWLTPANIFTALVVGGGLTCSINIGGVDLGGPTLGVIALVGALVLLVKALRDATEPAWVRFGRPAVLVLAGLYKLAPLALG